MGDCKDFTWQVPWKLPSPQQTWCTSKALQSLKAVAVKASALPSWQWPCSKPVCNPSPYSSFTGVFFWERKRKAETSTSGFCAQGSFWGKERGPGRHFSPLWLSAQTFPTLSLLCRPPPAQGPQNCRTFCSGLPGQWDKPSVCAVPWEQWNRGESVLSLVCLLLVLLQQSDQKLDYYFHLASFLTPAAQLFPAQLSPWHSYI